MAEIRLRNLTKRFGDVRAVSDLTLDAASGELVALLGPSGCGKTTTLRMVAGFETPTAGRILLGDRDVTETPPERRNCGMVFQHYALFPHLTVAQNVAFGLEMRQAPRAEIGRRVSAILERVGLAGLDARFPRQLSGGQQQRTALARALVINPSVLLLDEPLANLDAKLREEMRFYIRSLQREFGITTLYVTHDQAEALVLADRVAVLMDGVLRQFDPPEEIYHHPRSAAVAAFIGLTNLLPGRVASRAGDALVVETPAGQVRGRGVPELTPGRPAMLSVRPEHIDLDGGGAGPPGGGDGINRLRGVVVERTFLGAVTDFRVDVGDGLILRVQGRAAASHRTGERVALAFPEGAAWAVPPGDGPAGVGEASGPRGPQPGPAGAG
ncbi:MAG TPA: ABC transporter ATP-binding protein [bacterium]|nr:ABC transporter ATP-binding protein [bacterium]